MGSLPPKPDRQSRYPWVGVAVGSVAAALVAARALVGRVVVAGQSMEPAVLPGDRLLYLRTRRAAAGDVVVAQDPTRAGRLVVKRVASVSEATFDLRGDNPSASTDSRDYGPVSRRLVQGRAVYRYFPTGRAGRL